MLLIESKYDLSPLLNIMKVSFAESTQWKYVLGKDTTFEQMESLALRTESEWEWDTEDLILSVNVPFELWMIAVDMEIQKRTALTSSDFPDYEWKFTYEAGEHPVDAVIEFLFQVENELL